MDYSPKKLVQLLETKGYRLRRTSGSHQIFFHHELKKTVVVPMHGNKDIPKGTYFSIIKQAGISKDEL